MRIYKANYFQLYAAGLYLAQSDREEMNRLEDGRDPIDVLTASSGDPDVMHISDDLGNVLAVGGSRGGVIWFVHTEHAERLGMPGRMRMLSLLVKHLIHIKKRAIQERPQDFYHFTNIVSVGNTNHIKLLEYLGATWDEEPFHHNGHEFRQFYF